MFYENVRLSASVGAVYVQKYFHPEKKAYVLDMVDNIRNAFIGILNKITWMDEKTRKAAIDKANELSVHIGYPDELINTTVLEEYYSNLDMKDDDYFGNAIRLAQFKMDFAFSKLREPIDKNAWYLHSMPAVTNAFYSPVENSIRKLIAKHDISINTELF